MGYLDQGLPNAYCIVLEGDSNRRYKVFMSPDGTVVTSERTSLPPGVYQPDSDTIVTDKNISQSVESLYNRTTRADYTTQPMTAKDYIVARLELYQNLNFAPVRYLPKMTKALAHNLSAVKEAMVFHINDVGTAYDFLCFGYRKIIAEKIQDIHPFFVFPDRFFTAASFSTRFKNTILIGYINKAEMAIIPGKDEKDRMSIVMGLDWKEHTNYLEYTLIGDDNVD